MSNIYLVDDSLINDVAQHGIKVRFPAWPGSYLTKDSFSLIFLTAAKNLGFMLAADSTENHNGTHAFPILLTSLLRLFSASESK